MSLDIGAVVLRVQDLERMTTFWKAALDSVERRPAEPDRVTLRPRSGSGTFLSFDLRRSEYALPPRFHLDLYAEDRAAEVERLVALGARVIALDHGADVDWTLLEDLEGDRFDVTDLPDDV